MVVAVVPNNKGFTCIFRKELWWDGALCVPKDLAKVIVFGVAVQFFDASFVKAKRDRFQSWKIQSRTHSQPHPFSDHVANLSLPWTMHRSIDIRSLLVFRVGLGLFLCFDVVVRLTPWPYSLAWYTKDGFLEPHDSPHGNVVHRFWFARTDAVTQIGLFSATFVLAILFSAGFAVTTRPRLAVALQILLWILLVAQQHRCMPVHTGSDNFTRQMLLWYILLPVSVQQKIQGLGSKRYIPVTTSVASMATTGLLLQITLMYLGTVARRTIDVDLSRSDWLPPNLCALWYILRDAFAVREQWYVDLLRSLSFQSTQVMTALAMMVESSPLLWLFTPNTSSTTNNRCPSPRWVGFVLMESLHIGLLVLMRLPNWQTIALLANILWIPTVSWDRVWPLPDDNAAYKKTDEADGLETRNVTQPTECSREGSVPRRALTIFFLVYMLYNFGGERRWIPKHDGGDVGEFLRISQFWVMYNRAARQAKVTTVAGWNQEEEWVDVFQGLRTNRWEWRPKDTFESSKLQYFVAPRWERALHQITTSSDQPRATRFLQTLCRYVPSQVQSLEMRWEHYRIKRPDQLGRWNFEYAVPVRIECP